MRRVAEADGDAAGRREISGVGLQQPRGTGAWQAAVRDDDVGSRAGLRQLGGVEPRLGPQAQYVPVASAFSQREGAGIVVARGAGNVVEVRHYAFEPGRFGHGRTDKVTGALAQHADLPVRRPHGKVAAVAGDEEGAAPHQRQLVRHRQIQRPPPTIRA